MPPRVVLLVLDGFSPRHCTRAMAPNLVAAGEAGAWAPGGGRAVLASATYPNHASLVTGTEPAAHGIFANVTLTDTGPQPAEAVGARGVTLLDAARATGLTTAVVAGDPKILGVVGASRCNEHWPPGAVLPPGTPIVRGYAANAVTFRVLVDVLERGVDVVLCQLDNTDGLSHEFGPDSPEALAARAEADALVGELVGALRRTPRWTETILAVVSDHSQLATNPGEPPIDAGAALRRAGLEAEVIEEGSGALVRAREENAATRVLQGLDGVAGAHGLAPRVLYVYAKPGRGFSAAGRLPRGIHGCPTTTPALGLATGGHPGVAALREAFAREAPTSATWPRLLARAVGVPWNP